MPCRCSVQAGLLSSGRFSWPIPVLGTVSTEQRQEARRVVSVGAHTIADVPEVTASSPRYDHDRLIVRGAREHNLRDISVDLPRNSLIVFTGLSGSGKSSLAFDTIFAEGQRRYVESLSAYARQFLRNWRA